MEQIALIWDLDGTLLDSYDIIVSSLEQALAEAGCFRDAGEIRRRVLASSVRDYIGEIAAETGLPGGEIARRCDALNAARNLEIRPMPHAMEILRDVSALGIPSFVFTHKGKTTDAALENIGIRRYFTEIVTSAQGFPRKPCPDGVNYLIGKYRLDRARTFYIGDRGIDVECAGNAGIKSILFTPRDSCVMPTGKENFVVEDLLDILPILKKVQAGAL